MEFIETYNLGGLLIGAMTFLIIGLFHPIVIKAEYYFGVRCWWFFLIGGLASIAGSAMVGNIYGSVGLGVLGFTMLWSVKEIFEQRDRVRKGWFPANPKRKY